MKAYTNSNYVYVSNITQEKQVEMIYLSQVGLYKTGIYLT